MIFLLTPILGPAQGNNSSKHFITVLEWSKSWPGLDVKGVLVRNNLHILGQANLSFVPLHKCIPAKLVGTARGRHVWNVGDDMKSLVHFPMIGLIYLSSDKNYTFSTNFFLMVSHHTCQQRV